MATLEELGRYKLEWFNKYLPYQLTYFADFNYNSLVNILFRHRNGRGKNISYNDVIIMADTETSKKTHSDENHVVAWTISLRALGRNLVTLWGRKPSDLVQTIHKLMLHMNGEQTIVYWHNMTYDYTFLRQFLFKEFGYPSRQLNTKSHYPILIEWENGLIFKDSLILAQRSLDKWSSDLDVEHKKAVGKWDYDKLRNQYEQFSQDELEYIEHDTLAGVECIDKLMKQLNKQLGSMPYTATGIPREDVRKLAKENRGRDHFNRQSLDFLQYCRAEQIYHGGYTHANRHYIDTLITEETFGDLVSCRDFSSSYPYVMLSEKYPCSKFIPLKDKDLDYIIRNSSDHAFMFTLILIRPKLKDDLLSMPALQFSKCVKVVNPILDNGRILAASYVEIMLTEMDAIVIKEQYTWEKHICLNVETSPKDYLPRWFTDYVYGLYHDKTFLKPGADKSKYDPVAYMLAKAKLNSCYGMTVQKAVKPTIEEDYTTGEYVELPSNLEELYAQYLENHNSILPYQWGVWVTAYAFRNLFELGSCCKDWLYSDTDSCYGCNWDEEKLNAYNNKCKEKLLANGYGAVNYNGREYWLGIAEFDGSYSEFKVMGAKRYAGRSTEDGELHITVAGVPKKNGAKCLNNDLNNFTKGFIFDGKITGKLTHNYIYVPNIYVDSEGNETADSINLTSCDYLLDSVNVVDWEKLYEEVIEVEVYGEE